MQIKHFIGIDVSKESLDICLMVDNQVVDHCKITNSKPAIKQLYRKLIATGITEDSALWCMEFTGVYNNLLINFLIEQKAKVWVENPSQIKLSQGLVRGKNDKIDAQRIAQYAATFSHKFNAYVPKSQSLVQLKLLVNLRSKLNETKVGLLKTIKDVTRFECKETAKLIKQSSLHSVKALSADIEAIELKMMQIIKEDAELFALYKLITSVDGIGMQTAIAMLVTTNQFTRFTCPKKFACYAGVAPFEHQSGKSLKLKARVSQRANKEVKKLLHMAALTVLKIPNSEYQLYYNRKKAEGKNGMTIINSIRAKLISRVFACIRDNREYQKVYEYSTA